MPRDPTGASRQRQLLRISKKLAHAEPETALGVLQRCDQTPDVMLRTAAILLSEARSDGWLRATRRWDREALASGLTGSTANALRDATMVT